MGANPSLEPDSPECIRCGDCLRACRFSALSAGFRPRGPETKACLESRNHGTAARGQGGANAVTREIEI
jgi:ferredoxin